MNTVYPHAELGASTTPVDKIKTSHFHSHYSVCFAVRRGQQTLSTAAEAEASNGCGASFSRSQAVQMISTCCALNNATRRNLTVTSKPPALRFAAKEIHQPLNERNGTDRRTAQAHVVSFGIQLLQNAVLLLASAPLLSVPSLIRLPQPFNGYPQ